MAFDLDKWEADRLADLRATSDSWHWLVGSLAALINMTPPLTPERLQCALLDAEEYGNRQRDHHGIPAKHDAAEHLERIRLMFAAPVEA